MVITVLAQSIQEIFILGKNIHKNPITIIITNILSVMAYLPKAAQCRKKKKLQALMSDIGLNVNFVPLSMYKFGAIT